MSWARVEVRTVHPDGRIVTRIIFVEGDGAALMPFEFDDATGEICVKAWSVLASAEVTQ